MAFIVFSLALWISGTKLIVMVFRKKTFMLVVMEDHSIETNIMF